MSNAAAPISPAEMAKLLERWGASRASRGNGGHTVYLLNNQRVQIPGSGRKMDVTYAVLRKAATVVGTDIQSFLRGPNG